RYHDALTKAHRTATVELGDKSSEQQQKVSEKGGWLDVASWAREKGTEKSFGELHPRPPRDGRPRESLGERAWRMRDQSQRKGAGGAASAVGGFGVIDVLRVLGGIVLLNCALSYFVTSGDSLAWGYRPWFTRTDTLSAWWRGPIILTDAELRMYDGTDVTKPIYLALNGSVYDVSASRHTYGPGGSYHFFAGRDAARAFVTGCFEEDLTADLRGVENMFIPVEDPEEEVRMTKSELKNRRAQERRRARKEVEDAIEGWAKLFRGDKTKPYFKVGEVKREEGWLEKLPRRKLCEAAEKARPKRKKAKTTT
ncbi:hypothetical protein LTS18_005945, partial [Coniosporium uncinatum]